MAVFFIQVHIERAQKHLMFFYSLTPNRIKITQYVLKPQFSPLQFFLLDVKKAQSGRESGTNRSYENGDYPTQKKTSEQKKDNCTKKMRFKFLNT